MSSARYGLYWLATKARGQPVADILESLLESQFWSDTKMALHQEKLLDCLLRHAIANTPYYRNLMAGCGSQGGSSTKLNLSGFPFLTKDIIRAAGQSIYPKSGFGRFIYKTTGGSTGPPIRVRKDLRAMGHELAAAWRGFSWAGVHMRDRQARFWSVPTARRSRWEVRLTDFICNRKRYRTSGYDESIFARYARSFLRDQPDYVYGYTSMLREFAGYLTERNLVPDWPVKAAITTAESLTEMDRSIIRRGFGCRVYDEYGCGEVGTIAHECESGRIHINAENLLVEFIDEAGASVENGLGEVVVTDLRNLAMPLIRYRTGDLAYVDRARCDCGVSLPVIRDVVGRAYDLLVTQDGRKFHGSLVGGLFASLEQEGVHVDGYQVIQQIDHSLLVRLVANSNERRVLERKISRSLLESMGSTMALRFEYVESIPREPSGKVRRVKSMLASPQSG